MGALSRRRAKAQHGAYVRSRITAPVYDPGVYRVAIQNNFRIYYDDDGHPPGEDDHLLYRARFIMKERLAHRQTLVDILQKWRQAIEAG